MRYYVEPEVAGGWGEETVADTSVHPPIVHKLHYEMSGWLGDEILETFPCFIVSDELKIDLIKSEITGVEFDDVLVTKSDDFFAMPETSLIPTFYWMKIIGSRKDADVTLSDDHRLIVSDRAYHVLRRHRIAHAEITRAGL